MSLFGKLFGSGGKKPDKAKDAAPAKKAKAPAPVRAKRVNIDKRFTIIAETGQGSMSKVYKALDNQHGRVVCLKVQDKDKTAAAIARSGLAASRPPEGEIGLKLSGPHVVKTYEWGETPKGAQFIVMEFIDGVSLQFVRESRVVDLGAKLEILAQAAEGLATVHAAGFIHRDVGPKNLLVGREDFVKLIDFGLAVPNTPVFRRPGNRTGTLHYMAPELIRREPTDERIDIFSFGVTMFEFLTGKFPYDANVNDPMAMMRQRMNSVPRSITAVAPHLPAELSALVDKTLAKNPRERWQKMSTLPEALREVPVPAR